MRPRDAACWGPTTSPSLNGILQTAGTQASNIDSVFTNLPGVWANSLGQHRGPSGCRLGVRQPCSQAWGSGFTGAARPAPSLPEGQGGSGPVRDRCGVLGACNSSGSGCRPGHRAPVAPVAGQRVLSPSPLSRSLRAEGGGDSRGPRSATCARRDPRQTRGGGGLPHTAAG